MINHQKLFVICVFTSHELRELATTFQADVDGNGTIDYIEFITATMHRYKLEKEEHLYKAFQHFDKDNSGSVSHPRICNIYLLLETTLSQFF